MKNTEYATKDLHFAAFLKLRGLKLLRIDRVDDNYGERHGGNSGKKPLYFVFADKEYAKDLENKFWEGEDDILIDNIRKYVVTVKDLRTRIFSIIRNIN